MACRIVVPAASLARVARSMPDSVIAREGSAWVTYRVLHDHLGSLRAVVSTDPP